MMTAAYCDTEFDDEEDQAIAVDLERRRALATGGAWQIMLGDDTQQ
jgi:hypothetical protein